MYITAPNAEQKQEQAIVRRVLKAALAAGYSVAVFDDETHHPITTSEEQAWSELGETDIDRLYVYEGKSRVGSVLFIWGNGEDIVSDWSWNENHHGSEVTIDRIARA